MLMMGPSTSPLYSDALPGARRNEAWAYVHFVTTHAHFVERVLERTGLADEAAAAVVIEATLESIGEALLRPERTAIAASIPAPLGEMLSRRPIVPERDAAGFYASVAERAGLAPAFAMEHAQVVCRAVAESLAPELRRRLVRDLPDGFRELFEIPEPSAPPAERLHHSPKSTPPAATLAEGRPGSSHPVSESAPDRAHSESVARSPDPHEGSKISSAQGDASDAIADAHSAGKRPISGG